jgi:hypothetical protein
MINVMVFDCLEELLLDSDVVLELSCDFEFKDR